MLFGVRLRSLFTSRWLALLWAILVLLTALNLVGIHPELPEGMVYQEESVPFLRVETEGVFERRMEEVKEARECRTGKPKTVSTVSTDQ